jgi:hypothetical protein
MQPPLLRHWQLCDQRMPRGWVVGAQLGAFLQVLQLERRTSGDRRTEWTSADS